MQEAGPFFLLGDDPDITGRLASLLPVQKKLSAHPRLLQIPKGITLGPLSLQTPSSQDRGEELLSGTFLQSPEEGASFMIMARKSPGLGLQETPPTHAMTNQALRGPGLGHHLIEWGHFSRHLHIEDCPMNDTRASGQALLRVFSSF